MPDPLVAFYFRVEWGGTNFGFSEVSGLKIENQPIKYRDGLSPEFGERVFNGMAKYNDVTFSRGMVENDNEFFEWFNTIQLNKAERRDLKISMLNSGGNPVMSWELKNCIPISLEGPGLKSTGNETAIEKMVVAHEGMRITQG